MTTGYRWHALDSAAFLHATPQLCRSSPVCRERGGIFIQLGDLDHALLAPALSRIVSSEHLGRTRPRRKKPHRRGLRHVKSARGRRRLEQVEVNAWTAP